MTTPLCNEILGQIVATGGGRDITLVGEGVHPVFQRCLKAFVVEPLTMRPSGKYPCVAGLHEGGHVTVGGVLLHEGLEVGFFDRTLELRRGRAVHKVLFLDPGYRGRGIAVAMLVQAIRLYDELGISEVVLRAGLTVGRWYWARLGFDFVVERDRDAMRSWFTRVSHACKLPVDCSLLESAVQFALFEGPRKVSLKEIAMACPERANRLELAAEGCGVAPDEPLPLGQAAMLMGPDWDARLDLAGPGRAVAEIYAASRARRMADRTPPSP